VAAGIAGERKEGEGGAGLGVASYGLSQSLSGRVMSRAEKYA
jgi:hypothetical protein